MRLALTFLVMLLVVPTVHAEDPSFAEMERTGQQLKEDLAARQRERQEAYVKEPDSEEAHVRSIGALISTEQYDKALEVVDGLERLNPKSHRATLYRKQIKELKELGSAEVPNAMRRRHGEETFQAAKDDAMEGMDASALELVNSAGEGDTGDFLKKAEEMANRQSAEMKKRFPNLCKSSGVSKSPEDIHAQFAAQRRMMEIRAERGNQGLREAYPELILEHPDSKYLKVEHAKFLLREEKHTEARDLVQRAMEQFPDEPALILMHEELEKLESIISKERKAQHLQQLNRDLMTLTMAEMDCRS